MMFGMLFSFLGLLLVGGVVIALLIGGGTLLLNQNENDSAPRRGRKTTARETLDHRLARGEISREEYEEIRDQIES
jgi:uncharacterized membrane protein